MLMPDLLGPRFPTQPGVRLADAPGAQHEGQASTSVQMGTSGMGLEVVAPEAGHPSAVLTGDLLTCSLARGEGCGLDPWDWVLALDWSPETQGPTCSGSLCDLGPRSPHLQRGGLQGSLHVLKGRFSCAEPQIWAQDPGRAEFISCLR